MQITVILKGTEITLPIAAYETVQGLIYRAISGDPLYSSQVHNVGNTVNGRKFKLFTFSELKGKYQINEKTITYFTNVQFEIRSVDPYFIQLLLAYFSIGRTLRLGDNDVEVLDVRLSDITVFDNEITVRTASPITVYYTESNGHTVYFSPADEQFYRLLCANAKRKWISCYGNENGFDLTVAPIENCRFIKRATRFKETFITAWHGSFVLTGTPATINFLYNVGLGSKNSQGFGMFNIISPV